MSDDTPRVKVMCGEIERCEGELVDIQEVEGSEAEDGKSQDVILCIKARAETHKEGEPLSSIEVGKIVFLPQEEEPDPQMVKATAKLMPKPLVVEIEDVGVMDVALVVGESIAYQFSITNADTGDVAEGHHLYKKSVTVRFDVVSSAKSKLTLN